MSGGENQRAASGLAYANLEEGDRFIFLYPHHGDQPFAWLYVRHKDGHHRIDSERVHSPLGEHLPLDVRRVPANIPHANGMISLNDLEQEQ